MSCEGEFQVYNDVINFIGDPAGVSEVQDSYNSSNPLSNKPKSRQKKGSNTIILICWSSILGTFVVETKKIDLLLKKYPAKGTLGTN